MTWELQRKPSSDSGGTLVNSVATYPDLVALDPASYVGRTVYVEAYNYSAWTSNGSAFVPANGQYVSGTTTGIGTTYIAAASGLTWTATDNGSGAVRLNSSAPHGITTTPGVGAAFKVKTTQNGWTAEDNHTIATVVDASNIDLTTAYTSQGVPVFYLANEEVVVYTFTIDVLRATTQYMINFGVNFSTDAGGSSRRVKFRLGATELNNINLTSTTAAYNPYELGFANQNDVSSQVGVTGENSSGYTNNTLVVKTATEDTSTGALTGTIRFLPAVANVTMQLGWAVRIIRG